MFAALALVAFSVIGWYYVVYESNKRSIFSRLPGPPSPSFLLGHSYELHNERGWDFHNRLAEYGAVSRLRGMLGRPTLYVYDPAAMYSVLLKNKDAYEKSLWVLDTGKTLIGPGLLSATGDMHRKQRKMLTPVFSAKHFKDITPMFYASFQLVAAISARVQGGATPIDMLTWSSRTALELIGQAGIGYSFDPLVEDVPDKYADAVKNYIPNVTTGLFIILRQVTTLLQGLGARWLSRKMLTALPSENVRRVREIANILETRSRQIYEEKKKAAAASGGVGDGKDLMSILLKANLEATEEDRLPEDEVIAQTSTFIFAAMDTTSNAISRTLQVLSEHPEAQEKLRQEVISASGAEELEYDVLHKLPYLDAVCRETMRLYPPVATTFREAMQDTVLPLSDPVRATDGTLIQEVPIPRGTHVMISILNCNKNKALWGRDADEWKPERWLQPLPADIENASIPGVYAHLMTFLGGKRSCIGFKFSQLEMKVVISSLVKEFVFERSEKPIVWNLSGVSYPTASEGSTKPEMWLNVRKVSV